ncbi:MAG TPA: S16 family serine protease, partial [Candidatus Caenarcaniphilales bacterium]|nr:S16 family serine protease [Candidatus Caenarcaniphilales bacterium]
SSLRDRPARAGTVCFGEIGLTGEVRPVRGIERRLRETGRLGFVRAIVPRSTTQSELPGELAGLEVVTVGTLRDAVAAALQPAGANPEHSLGAPVEAASVLGSRTP